MSGWLSRAKEALSGREAEVALEPVEIACPCGRKVEATRRPTFQRVLCKSCGEPFFLLPLDVYPRPVMKVRKVRSPKSAESTKSKGSQRAGSAAKPASANTSIDLQAELRATLAKVRAKFTPLRIIALSLLCVIVLTGWFQWNRLAKSNADQEFRIATEAGMTALQKSDYVEAAQHFGRAAAAADVLQRTDAAAEKARQQFRQLSALNSLMTRSLFEIIESAQATRMRESALAAESEFANLHAGRWIVLQSEVAPAMDASSSNAVAWEQRLQISNESLILTGRLPIFAEIRVPTAPPATSDATSIEGSPVGVLALNDLGQREILFAAQVESLKWDAETTAWVLTLKSSSGFFWTDYDLLIVAGLLPDELQTEARLRAILLEQSHWIGAAE